MGLSVTPDISSVYNIPTIFTFSNDTEKQIVISCNTDCPFTEWPDVYIDFNSDNLSLLICEPSRIVVSYFSESTGILENTEEYILNVCELKPHISVKNFGQIHYFVDSITAIIESNTDSINISMTNLADGSIVNLIGIIDNSVYSLELLTSCKLSISAELNGSITTKEYICLKVANNSLIPYFTTYTEDGNTINEIENLGLAGAINLMGEYNSVTNTFLLGQYSTLPFLYWYSFNTTFIDINEYALIPGKTKFYYKTHNLSIHMGNVRLVIYEVGNGLGDELFSAIYDTEGWFELSTFKSISIRLEWSTGPYVISNTYVEITCLGKRELLPNGVYVNAPYMDYDNAQFVSNATVLNLFPDVITEGLISNQLITAYKPSYDTPYIPSATIDCSLPTYENSLPIVDGYLQGYIAGGKLIYLNDLIVNREIIRQGLSLYYNIDGIDVYKLIFSTLAYTLMTENCFGLYLSAFNCYNFSDSNIFLDIHNEDIPKWTINGSLKAPYGQPFGYIGTYNSRDFYFPQQISVTYKYTNPFGDMGNLTIYTVNDSFDISLVNGIHTESYSTEIYNNGFYLEYSYWVDTWQSYSISLEILEIKFTNYEGIVNGPTGGGEGQ